MRSCRQDVGSSRCATASDGAPHFDIQANRERSISASHMVLHATVEALMTGCPHNLETGSKLCVHVVTNQCVAGAIDEKGTVCTGARRACSGYRTTRHQPGLRPIARGPWALLQASRFQRCCAACWSTRSARSKRGAVRLGSIRRLRSNRFTLRGIWSICPAEASPWPSAFRRPSPPACSQRPLGSVLFFRTSRAHATVASPSRQLKERISGRLGNFASSF